MIMAISQVSSDFEVQTDSLVSHLHRSRLLVRHVRIVSDVRLIQPDRGEPVGKRFAFLRKQYSRES